MGSKSWVRRMTGTSAVWVGAAALAVLWLCIGLPKATAGPEVQTRFPKFGVAIGAEMFLTEPTLGR